MQPEMSLFEGLKICIVGDCIGQKRLQILQSNVTKNAGTLLNLGALLDQIACSKEQPPSDPLPVQLVTVLPMDRLLAVLNSQRHPTKLTSLFCPNCGRAHVRLQSDTFITAAVGARRRPASENLIAPAAPAPSPPAPPDSPGAA